MKELINQHDSLINEFKESDNNFPHEIKQSKEILDICTNVINWVYKNVADSEYIDDILNYLRYAMRYGIITTSNEFNGVRIISFIFNSQKKYNLYIYNNEELLSILTEIQNSTESITKSIVISLIPIGEDKIHNNGIWHSKIEVTKIYNKLYDLQGKTFKDSISEKIIQFYSLNENGIPKINSDIKTILNKTEIIKDSYNSKNNRLIIKSNNSLLSRIICQSNIVLCYSKENIFSLENGIEHELNQSRYLVLNNGSDEKIITDNKKCMLSLKEYADILNGTLDVIQKYNNYLQSTLVKKK